jgi:hypothetical protein
VFKYICGTCNRTFESEADLDAHDDEEHMPKRIAPDASVSKPIREGSTMTPEQAWGAVLEQLQTEMPRASFDTWVRDTKPVRYGGNTLSINARNAYARDWLESRLQSTVERKLVGIMNQASVEVVFVSADTVEVE